MMVVGIIVSSLGGVGILTGLVVTLGGNRRDSDAQVYGGLGTMIVSIALGCGLGIPLAAVGSRKVPKESKAVPDVKVSPMGGSLTWSF